MASDNDLIVEISATTELLRQQMVRAENQVATFERNTNKRLNTVDRNFDKLGKGAGRLKTALAGFGAGAVTGILASFSVDTLIGVARRSLETGSALGELSQQLGVTTDDLQTYRYIATQTGIAQETMDSSLGKLTKSIGAAAQGSKKQVAALSEIGFSIAEIESGALTAGVVIPRLADALAKIPEPARRAALETALFGKSGQELDTLLAGGSTGLRKFSDEYERLGIKLSGDQIKRLDDAADAYAKLKLQLEGEVTIWLSNNTGGLLGFINDLGDFVREVKAADAEYSAFVHRFEKPVNRDKSIFQNAREAGRATGQFFGFLEPTITPAPRNKVRGGRNAPKFIGPAARSDPADAFLGGRSPTGPYKKVSFLDQPANTAVGAGGGIGALSAMSALLSVINVRAILAAASIGTMVEQTRKLPKEAQDYLDAFREEARIDELRAQGRDREAEQALSLARIREQFPKLGIADLVYLEKAVVALQDAAYFAAKRRDAEAEWADIFKDSAATDRDALDRITARGDKAIEALFGDEAKARGEDNIRQLAGLYESLFRGGTDDLWRHFEDIGVNILSQLAAQLTASIFGGGTGGFGGGGGIGTILSLFGLPGFAEGGSPKVGKLAMVGERGPELFIPRVPGTIVSNDKLNGFGGAGSTVNFTINAPGATAETVARIRQEIASAAPHIVAAAQSATVRTLARPRLP